MEVSASRELNLGRDMAICARNFRFRCNLAGKKKGRHGCECLARGGVSLPGVPRYRELNSSASSRLTD